MARKHPLKPFYSVLVPAFVCSVLVAAAAVGLRPLQKANRALDMKNNVLLAAGIYDPARSVEKQFNQVEARVIKLATGRFVLQDEIDPTEYDPREAALSDEAGKALPRDEDPARIRRLKRFSIVYLVKQDGALSEIVLSVMGKGLWSTMYAFVAVDQDLSTVRGISFYEHGETPGLGGEVANPRWERGWRRKKIYSPEGEPAPRVLKSGTQVAPADAPYRVDGLSGATLTTKGVDALIAFWFGDSGFGPFIDRLRGEGGFHD